ncbi:MAG: hypothetical protein M1370_05285 [Bacteroidetes bacterium]|nr:hypothetical protein [Bacteroidota bacterium]MCL5027146.1 hypothetical protein [Chloroflexota bacterium]
MNDSSERGYQIRPGLTEGLILAVLSLPKPEKVKLISRLVEDPEARGILGQLLVGILASSGSSNQEQRPSGALVQRNPARTPILTSREHGEQERQKYISGLQHTGIVITRQDGIWATTSSGIRVGLAFATERRLNRWFLGLKEDEVLKGMRGRGACAVLLCQPQSGPILDFVLPAEEIRTLVNALSKSQGQLKFNVTRTGNHYQLLRRGQEPLDITEYLGKADILKA